MKIKYWVIVVSLVCLSGCTAALVSALTPSGGGGSSGLTSLLVLLGLNRPSGGSSSGYSLSSAFSYTSNPNGVWSYGWKSTTTGTLTIYDSKWDSGFSRSWYYSSYGSFPNFSNNYASSGGVSPGETNMHPGSSGQISVLRWTAPQAGTISIKGSFKAGDTGAVDVYILKNTTTLFSKTSTLITESYDQTTTVAIGDTVDFQVGNAGNYTSDATPIDGVIAYTSTATTTTTPEIVIPYIILKTGQTTVYATGDDGTNQSGTARSYTDNSDGTIKDNATGLFWQKCSRGLSGTTCASGSATTADWSTAGSYCTGLSLASKTWRLPTIKELGDLVDYGTSPPLISITFFPNTVTVYYWSSITLFTDTTQAWIVDFINSNVENRQKTDGWYVRCVSGP